MNLHTLQRSDNRVKAKRVGRGGKRGTTSGRGQKGQKSRSGHRMRPAARDLILRIPKKRGFRNKEKSDQPAEVIFALLAKKLAPFHGKKDVVIDEAFLKGLSLVPMRHRSGVKLIGTGDISLPLTVKGVKVSKGVRAAIEKAGGQVIANNANESK